MYVKTSDRLKAKLKCLFVFLVVFWMGLSPVLAQQKTITGTVTDANNQPLSGASIVVKGRANTGVTTDTSGNYTISANVGDVLVISSVGHSSREERVGAQNVINFTL